MGDGEFEDEEGEEGEGEEFEDEGGHEGEIMITQEEEAAINRVCFGLGSYPL